ncbi:MAG TPA: DNA-processing protein DprA [Limnochorda sp.]
MSSGKAARERLDLLRLYGALPFHQARKLLKSCATASRAWRRYPEWPLLGVDQAVWLAAKSFTRSWAGSVLQRLEQAGIRVVLPSMAGYPRALAAIEAPPPLLFIRGEWRPMDEGAVSIVGTRRPTPYGEGVAAELAAALAREGVTVVSGLARGIDAAAHRAALEAGGRTVAVMGTGPDRIYPPEHRELARAIEAHGALITEYPPGTPPAPYAFPHRNRIIAALGLVTVVVEAGARSGALITARLADELSRPVYAVPGPIGRPQSVGCHRLIQDGACLLASVEELLELVRERRGQGAVQGRLPGLGHPEPAPADPQGWLLRHLDQEPRTAEELALRCGADVGAVQAGLTLLELRGLALRVGGRFWRRGW